jgi:hypothetical protein
MNKNLLILLIVVVVFGGGYLLWNMMAGGGYFAGDIPEYRPVEDTPAQQAPPPAQELPTGIPGMAMPGIGGGVPVGGEAATPGTPAAPGDEAPGISEAPSETEIPLTQEEKRDELAAFEQIDSNDIIRARLKEAEASETLVDPEEDLPYPDTGRTDPLMIITSAIPEEIRPPRSGETDYDSILEYIIKSYGTAILDSVEIEVWSVMQIGLYELVNMSINGRLLTMSEGSSYDMQMGYQETLRISMASASQSLVTIGLTYSTPYGSVSKTKTYIPKD